MATHAFYRGKPHANQDLTPQQLRLRAESYCAATEHCAYDVRQKLLAWGADSGTIDSIIDHLYDQKYLDDMRYCHAFTHDKLLYQHWGKSKIRYMLQARQLPSRAIAHAIQSIDEHEYLQILRQVASKKPNATNEQVYRFLLQRGFDYTDIRRALSIDIEE